MANIHIPLKVKCGILLDNILARIRWVRWIGKHDIELYAAMSRHQPPPAEVNISLSDTETDIYLSFICDVDTYRIVHGGSERAPCSTLLKLGDNRYGILIVPEFFEWFTVQEQEVIIRACMWRITHNIPSTYRWWQVKRMTTDALACDDYMVEQGYKEVLTDILTRFEKYGDAPNSTMCNDALLSYRLKRLK